MKWYLQNTPTNIYISASVTNTQRLGTWSVEWKENSPKTRSVPTASLLPGALGTQPTAPRCHVQSAGLGLCGKEGSDSPSPWCLQRVETESHSL